LSDANSDVEAVARAQPFKAVITRLWGSEHREAYGHAERKEACLVMIDCQTMGRLLHPYLDGELSAREPLDIQAHLESCPDCAALYRNEKLFLDLLKGSLLVPVAPDGLRQRVRKVVEAAGLEK